MRVLVIRLGAFGDFVQSFAPFAAIRATHPGADITLLTTAPFAGLARASPWFDRVEIDARPSWWNLPGLARLRRQLAGFDLVYDLQTSGRSSRYFALAGRPPWSGIAPGCSLPHANPARDAMHTKERQREQLQMAGISHFPPPDLDQIRADWLWAVEQTPTKEFDRYRGLTIAAHRGQVLGASDRPLHLQLDLARRLTVHPEQLVMAHIEPSLWSA